MWPLFLGLAIMTLAGALLLPLPLWTVRALRGGRRRLALPPAVSSPPPVGALDPALATAATEARIVADAVSRAVAATDDVLATFAFLRVMTSRRWNQNESWATATVDRLHHDVGEATRLYADWLRTVAILPERAVQDLSRRGFDVDALLAPHPETALALPEPAPSTTLDRTRLTRTRLELHEAFSHISTFLESLTRSADPYR